MIDVDDLVREGLSEEAGGARFAPGRWARTVTDLPRPRGSRLIARRRVLPTLAGVAAAVVLIGAVVVPLAVLSRLGSGPNERRPGAGSAIDRFGIQLVPPEGWEGRAFQHGDTRYILLANFRIPPDIAGFSSELRNHLGPDQVTVFLQEYARTCPCPGFDPVELPVSIERSDMTSFEGVPSEHAFARRAFVASERWFDLWVEFGTESVPDARLAEVNEVLGTLRITPGSGWIAHQDRDDAMTVFTPETWTWREDPVPNLGEPRILFAAGTWAFPMGGGCGPEAALEELPANGALLWLLEYRVPSNADDFPARPVRLALSGEPETYECATARPTYLLRFRDGFRYFQLHVALGNAAAQRLQDDVVDVLNSLQAGLLPATERLARAIELCDRLPWVECPFADWVRNTIWEAGFAVDGRTDSAIVGSADGGSFYMWTTTNVEDPLEPGYGRLMEVQGVTVYGGSLQATWVTSGVRVWVQAGPTDRSLPTEDQLAALVRASLRTPI
jgi:hypothetical protein